MGNETGLWVVLLTFAIGLIPVLYITAMHIRLAIKEWKDPNHD